jgi:pimeloyl-ACP methyl ester carboxylesterase
LEKVLLSGAGPFVHLERPIEVNRRIVEFIRAG